MKTKMQTKRAVKAFLIDLGNAVTVALLIGLPMGAYFAFVMEA